jgi:SAM-dependent methyltransferase
VNQYVQLHLLLSQIVRSSAERIVPLVSSWLRPTSVVDVGCGNGTWLSCFKKSGAETILGIDGEYIKPEALEIPIGCFQSQDLTKPLQISGKFDLAVCTEVLEHLPEKPARELVGRLTQLAPFVLFSAAIPGQGGAEHINEQWQSYWVNAFAEQGYHCWDVIRPVIWTNKDVAFWYAQNLFLFCDPSQSELLPASVREKAGPGLDIVHPTAFITAVREGNSLKTPSISESLSYLGRAFTRRLKRTVRMS